MQWSGIHIHRHVSLEMFNLCMHFIALIVCVHVFLKRGMSYIVFAVRISFYLWCVPFRSVSMPTDEHLEYDYNGQS